MMKFFEKISGFAQKHPYLACLALLTALIGLPLLMRPAHIPDEGRYAEVARDMLVNRHWLVPHINEYPHLTKPPTFYALAAVLMAALGKKMVVVRLVSALAYLAFLLYAVKWSGKKAGRGASALTALIGATMFQPMVGAEFGDLNTLFTLFIALGHLYFFDALQNPKSSGKWYAAWFFWGLAFLTKGPPTIIIAAFTIILYRLLSGRKIGIPVKSWIAGLILWAVVSFPWYIWILAYYGKTIIEFWGVDVVRRTAVASAESGESGVPGFYIPVFLMGGAAWSALAILEVFRSAGSRNSGTRVWRFLYEKIRSLPPDMLWLFCWCAGTILAFSLLMAKMLSYIQPCYPAFILFLALYFARKMKWKKHKALARTFFASGFLFIVLFWGIPIYGFFSADSRGDVKSATFVNNKHFEAQWIANRLENLGDRYYILVQYKLFEGVFNFHADRLSVLVKEEIHPQWPSPARRLARRWGMMKWVEENRPVVVILEPEKLRQVSGDGWENLKLIYEGEDYCLMSTPSSGLRKISPEQAD